MSAAKTAAWGVMVYALMGAASRADSISSADGTWVYFLGGGTSQNAAVINPVVLPRTPAFTLSSSPAAPSSLTEFSSPVFSSNSAPSTTPRTTYTSSLGTSSGKYDAFINLTSGNFADASTLLAGNPQPWYTSGVVTKFFGGSVPDQNQQQDFARSVLQEVQHTFDMANLHPSLTLDPNAPANHTLSVVSGASYGPNPNAIGITNVGRSGFGLIDKFGYAQTLDELETAVAKNISHELMHAFGVANHPEETGNYVDAAVASWSMLTDKNATFSSSAVQAINDTSFNPIDGTSGAQVVDGAQEILAPVPEPLTIALWSIGLLAGATVHRRNLRRAA